jgi:hypothetical protein
MDGVTVTAAALARAEAIGLDVWWWGARFCSAHPDWSELCDALTREHGERDYRYQLELLECCGGREFNELHARYWQERAAVEAQPEIDELDERYRVDWAVIEDRYCVEREAARLRNRHAADAIDARYCVERDALILRLAADRDRAEDDAPRMLAAAIRQRGPIPAVRVSSARAREAANRYPYWGAALYVVRLDRYGQPSAHCIRAASSDRRSHRLAVSDAIATGRVRIQCIGRLSPAECAAVLSQIA